MMIDYWLVAVMVSCMAAPIDNPNQCETEEIVLAQYHESWQDCFEDALSLFGVKGVVSVKCHPRGISND